MLKPRFDVGTGRPLSDQDFLALLRLLVSQTDEAVKQSQAAIIGTREAIALLDRLSHNKHVAVAL